MRAERPRRAWVRSSAQERLPGRQRNRPVLVDALAVIGAALRCGAVQLPVAGVGNDPRLRGVGGRGDPGPASRFRDRCRFGSLYPLARDLAPPPPGDPSAAAGVAPVCRVRSALRIESHRQLSAEQTVHPCDYSKIRRPASSSISLTHAPCITSICIVRPTCRMRRVISCIVLTTSGCSGWPG